MNKITSKYCCIFAMNEIRRLNNIKHKPKSSINITRYINNEKRKWKSYYNLAIKHKLGKRGDKYGTANN